MWRALGALLLSVQLAPRERSEVARERATDCRALKTGCNARASALGDVARTPPRWGSQRHLRVDGPQPLVVFVTATLPSGVTPDLARMNPLPLARVHFIPVVMERQVKGPRVIDVP